MSNEVLFSEDGWSVYTKLLEPRHRGYYETVFCTGNGYMAARATCPELGDWDLNRPATLVAGLYEGPPDREYPPRLVICPDWTGFRFSDGDGELTAGDGEVRDFSMSLNMLEGTFSRKFRWQGAGGKVTDFVIVRHADQVHRHLFLERVEIVPVNYDGKVSFSSIVDSGVRPSDRVLQHRPVQSHPVGDGGSRNGVVSVGDGGSRNGVVVEVQTVTGKVTVAVAVRLKAGGAAGEVRSSADIDGSVGSVTVAFAVRKGAAAHIDRVVAVVTSRDGDGGPGFEGDGGSGSVVERAAREIDSCPAFDIALERHQESWNAYWAISDVEIGGDPESQWKVRLALYHLWTCASKNTIGTDSSVGARGIHGEGYNGHIFWDTELFMLPFFTLVHPDVACSLLKYRYDRLGPARERARRDGCLGARFPWESADSGEEVTPAAGITPEGKRVLIATGEQEIHITADIAFSVFEYCRLTADEQFYLECGAEILLDTALYWVSRLEPREFFPHQPDASRSGERPRGGQTWYEITGVMGPDEYHEAVSNNAFTNALARWNIRTGIRVAEHLTADHPEVWEDLSKRVGVGREVLEEWREMADRIVIPYDKESGLFPQFDGFFELRDVADRCGYRSRFRPDTGQDLQVLKQADTLLLLHLLPELANRDSRRRHYDYYVPRTTHESSLSPSIHAIFAADAGYPDEAIDFFRLALARDFSDPDGDCDAGVHSANLGGIWQAVVAGFGGLRWGEKGLSLNPKLPSHWTCLSFSVNYRSLRARFSITHQSVSVSIPGGEGTLPLWVDDKAFMLKAPSTNEFSIG